MSRNRTGKSTGADEQVQDSLTVEPSDTQCREPPSISPHSQSSDDQHSDEGDNDELRVAEADSQGFWEALEIIDETSTQYFIKWAGTDERGRPWPPSWEPKSNANAKLIKSWKKYGKKRCKERKEAEKEAKKNKKREEKEKKQVAKQKKAKGKKIMKMKEESPDPQFTEDAASEAREPTKSASPAPLPFKNNRNRKRVVPDSEASSQAQSELHQSKKQKADTRPSKQVTFELGMDSSPLSSVPSSTDQPLVATNANVLQSVITASEEIQEVAPVASSGESSVSIVPDSQPAPEKTFDYASSPARVSRAMEEEEDLMLDYEENFRPIARPVSVPVSTHSHSQSFPSMDSPGTNHSDLESDVTHGDDDVPIFNDYSQREEEIEEEEERQVGQQSERTRTMESRPSHATTSTISRPLGPVPVPRAAAFFPPATQPPSSQFDPIEDPDTSPFRPSLHQQRSFDRADSPLAHPRPVKTRLELVLGPPEEDEIAPPLSAFQAELIAAAALAYVSPEVNIESDMPSRSLSRAGSRSSLVKRPASRPVIAPISIEISSGTGGVAAAVTTVAQAVGPEVEDREEDDEDDDDEEDDLSPGGFNEDYFACDLLATQKPIDFDEVVNHDGAVAGNKLPELDAPVESRSRTEATDAGEGGGSNHYAGGGEGYPYYSSHQPPQQQQQTYQNSVPGYAPASASGAGYGGGGGGSSASGGQGGAPGGYSYPAHYQGSHHAQHSGKREYEEDREESAKRARMEQHQQQQQQHYYQQQQQEVRHYSQHSYSQQQYSQSPAYGYPTQSHAYSSNRPTPPPAQHHYSPPPPQPQSVPQYHSPSHYPQQYQQLPPMQTSVTSAQAYSRSNSQLPPIQQALSNEGYSHQPSASSSASRPPPAPAPTVSVAAASPPPRAPSPTAASAAHLTSPSIARVQGTETYANPNSVNPTTNAQRSPSPHPPTQPLPQAARTGSPAPASSLEGVNDLIELVRASTQIEASDGTKEEIVRFLKNPRSYGDGALARADFWAFELRRQMLDVGERVDFIILYTREGTFKLKRSPTTTIPVEFARSLNHAPDRKRGQTPAVDAVLTLQASASAPPPLAVSTMTREQLEQEVTALRAQLSTQATELASLRPLAEETTKLRTEVATLTLATKQLKNSRDSAQQDMAYIQEQYSIASTAASARAQEAAVAEAQAARLQGLLDAGLKQKTAFYEAGVKRWKMELDKMQKQVELMKVERRKMNEQGIREKAGKWDEVVARRAQKHQREQERKTRIEANGGVANEGEADDLDSEEESVSSLLLGDGPKSSTPPPATSSPRESIVKLVPDNSLPSSSAAPSSSSVKEEVAGYPCEWRGETQLDSQEVPTTTACGQLCPTRDALKEHVFSHLTSS